MASRDAHDDRIAAALTRTSSGDEAGFTELYRLLAGKVAGYVRGRGVRDAEDVTNEVFLAAFRDLPHRDFTPIGFRAWLFGIAHNKTVDWYRVQRRRPAISDDTIGAQPVGGDVEADAMAVLGDAQVADLLGALTDDQRSVLLLRVVADLSLDETAMALDKPVGAVKSLQRRALDALRRVVDEPIDRQNPAEPVSRDDFETMTGSRCTNTTR